MSGREHQIFADELARFAAEAADPALTAISERVTAPLRVAVQGRRGVGRRTVTHALIGAGIDVTFQPDTADLDVYVIAEVVKPEDRNAIEAARHPVLMVLNKADSTGLSDSGGNGEPSAGPIAAARVRCARFSALTGVPTEPMVGILAVAALDGLPDHLWAALRVLAARTLGSGAETPGEIAAGCHSVPALVPALVPAGVWRRLLDALGLFGIAHAVAALGQAGSVAESVFRARTVLRLVSCVDAVVDRLAAVGSEVHYRRILEAVAELETLAVTDRRINGFLSRDETVLARMAAAVPVIESAGLTVDRCDDPDGCLRRAVEWRRYRRGPVTAVHRACGTDIARGSLRLWSRAGTSR